MARVARAIRGAFALTHAVALSAHAQRPAAAHIREYEQAFTTYPFSDPDPIPAVGRIYPYFRFDGFTDQPVSRRWKVVELENAYLRVLILPEIGGKIWAAIEKRSGRPFIYFNHVVKFRDIAMRGPWTSGGIEANYGIIGHTPNVSTPVEYVTRTNADGSVSCITGALDLLTNTTWRLETRLAPGRAAFTTTSTWHNGSPLEQPYYTWMTAGIPTAGNLEYVFPGTAWIGHEGEQGTWPINAANGRDVSRYEQNDFGPYKSYHVLGEAGDFFGAWWRDLGFGMARVAPRDEKPGQKIWIWGLSRQGMLWEQLLTDHDGQYSELQSGRLFNQTGEGSTRTPFKHRTFIPHVTDRWTEQWQPVVGTGGFRVASAVGALNVTRAGERLVVALAPVEAVDDTLVVTVAGRRVRAVRVRRAPLEAFVDTIPATGAALADVRVVLGDHRIEFDGNPAATRLDRPLEAPGSFDWGSGYGLALKGKELLREREYDRATATLDSALAREPHHVGALADRAALAIRAMQYDSARGFARHALAVDAYDGAANYYYGLANRRLGRTADARDGFEIASQDPGFRAAACTELAKLWLAARDERRAADYAAKALRTEPANLDALQVRVVIARRAGRTAEWRAALRILESADPLGVMAPLEAALVQQPLGTAAVERVRQRLHGEMPEQSLLQLAAWYQDVDERTTTLRILEALGDHPEALYWRADLAPGAALRDSLVARANGLSSWMIFPFRPEVIAALERVVTRSDHWKPRYYLALGLWATGRASRAALLLDALGDTPDFAPFYAARATLPGRSLDRQVADLRRAAALEPTEWRFAKRLAERLLALGDAAGAEAVASAAHERAPRNYMLGLTRVRALMEAGRIDEADRRLAALAVLPYEGAGDGRALHRELKLLLAVEAVRAGQLDSAARLVAAAREWPEHLGAGKPYDADTDERLEEWLAADIAARAGNADVARARWTNLAGKRARTGALGDALVPWALEKLGRADEARTLIAEWRRAAPSDPVVAWAADRTLPLPRRAGQEFRPLTRWLALTR
ncbi:MAG: DUF5107 domain-containing protein [Gemmatimonadetes bacterium]|nr:DUF5107 domain-containing protein [Gemmatimonadota bacterium]